MRQEKIGIVMLFAIFIVLCGSIGCTTTKTNIEETPPPTVSTPSIVTNNTQTAEMLNFKGFDLLMKGDNPNALEIFNQALLQENHNPIILNNIGFTFSQRGSYQEAIKYYDRAISIDSQDSTYYYNKANALNKLGKQQEAQTMIDTALSIHPNSDWDTSTCDINKADIRVSNPVVIDPLNAQIWIEKARKDGEHFNIDCLLIDYSRATEIDPKNAQGWNNYGVVQAWHRNFNEAKTSFEKAILLDPTNQVILKNKNAIDLYSSGNGVGLSGDFYKMDFYEIFTY